MIKFELIVTYTKRPAYSVYTAMPRPGRVRLTPHTFMPEQKAKTLICANVMFIRKNYHPTILTFIYFFFTFNIFDTYFLSVAQHSCTCTYYLKLIMIHIIIETQKQLSNPIKADLLHEVFHHSNSTRFTFSIGAATA